MTQSKSRREAAASAARHSYPCEVGLEQWCELVRGRFWSTFHGFSQEELASGVAEIREGAHARRAAAEGATTLKFEDRLVFIEAS